MDGMWTDGQKKHMYFHFQTRHKHTTFIITINKSIVKQKRWVNGENPVTKKGMFLQFLKSYDFIV